jgi:hypothetical protein
MKQALKDILRKPFQLLGYDLHRIVKQRNHDSDFGENQVVPNVWKRTTYLDLLADRLKSASETIALLGSVEETSLMGQALHSRGFEVKAFNWDWDSQLPDLSAEMTVALCKVPMNEPQWRAVRSLKQKLGRRLIGLPELVLPATTIRQAQASLTYALDTLEDVAPYYLGEKYFGPLDELNELFPLAGKSIIEFGPMEGAQTAGLVKLGAKHITCIEARAESYIKTAVAQYALGWDNVKVVMDDFHNADDLKYGVFDLAFAHGVYYHSIAPFFLFENLISLSKNIFLGGYTYDRGNVLRDSLEGLEYEGKKYELKRIPTGRSFNTGINQYGYHFTRDGLVGFFADRGYDVKVIADKDSGDPWGDRYLTFLASKRDE